MNPEQQIANFFRLNDQNWMKHANPWSVWTRYSVLPALVLAFWSRTWIGWWCLIPGAAAIAWMFLNPLLFAQARSTRNWASRAVLGERVFLNRDKVKLPPVHRSPIHRILNGISSVGFLLASWGTITFSLWGVLMGISLAYLGKSWYLDRMVWLYEDMKSVNETYQSWDY